MAIAVRLPKLGRTMVDGTIVSMKISEGDEVNQGDVIFEIQTDKATLEVESVDSGIVQRILVGEGETIAVNTTIAVLGQQGEEVDGGFVETLRKENAGFTTEKDDELVIEDESHLQCGRAVWSCLTDSEESPIPAEETPAKEAEGKTIPLSRLQKLLGKRMTQSKRDIPCFYLTAKVDVTDIISKIDTLNTGCGVDISIDDFVVSAIATNLGDFPLLTGQIGSDFIRLAQQIGVGVVMEVEDGAVSPVIKDADKKTVPQIAVARQELILKAKNRKLLLEDLEGACISLSNTGIYGVDMFIPVVIPGQCSIIGIGRVKDECVPGGRDQIDVRKLMKITIAVDHRIANGADAGQFLDHVKKMLENTEDFNY